jgi:hypothetical protein
MPADRLTATLPARAFSATAALHARPGFPPGDQGEGWAIPALLHVLQNGV